MLSRPKAAEEREHHGTSLPPSSTQISAEATEYVDTGKLQGSGRQVQILSRFEFAQEREHDMPPPPISWNARGYSNARKSNVSSQLDPPCESLAGSPAHVANPSRNVSTVDFLPSPYFTPAPPPLKHFSCQAPKKQLVRELIRPSNPGGFVISWRDVLSSPQASSIATLPPSPLLALSPIPRMSQCEYVACLGLRSPSCRVAKMQLRHRRAREGISGQAITPTIRPTIRLNHVRLHLSSTFRGHRARSSLHSRWTASGVSTSWPLRKPPIRPHQTNFLSSPAAAAVSRLNV
ncbi:hypothetical protein DFH07DRAFT_855798 [Mycena maculata]|uniref:Uncharacterized protein n=1 Tax=Mycena maculata TaxID=230809 RepID=A0AAD7MM24_9AGAR|nr:hypothetical protein DFH07DRAFT_855798 [Mycena maculata]